MRIDHLTQHLDELFSTAASHYAKIRKGHEEEAIHQPRVSLKKINAVFRLGTFVAPQSFKTRLAFEPLKEIFELSGLVRDLQITHQVLFQYQIVDKENIQKFLNDELGLAIWQLVEWIKRNPSNKLFTPSVASTQHLKAISQARWLKGMVGYIDYLFQKIEILMSSKRKDKWHQVVVCGLGNCCWSLVIICLLKFVISEKYEIVKTTIVNNTIDQPQRMFSWSQCAIWS